MPKFTIALSPKTVLFLRVALQRHNDNQGTSLTLKQFLHLHLQELAVADDLQVAVVAIQQQHERAAAQTLQNAILAARDEMIAALE